MVNEEDFKLQTCFHCGNIGLLRIVHKYSYNFGGPSFDEVGQIVDYDLQEHFDWFMLSCPVCHKVTLRQEYSDEYTHDFYTSIETLYPQSSIDYVGVPENIKTAFEAALKVKNIDTAVCALSLRRVLEAICKERGAKGKNLERMIDDMISHQILPQMFVDACWIIRQLGNSAAHGDSRVFSMYQIDQTILFVQNIINYLYTLPVKIKKLRNTLETEEARGENKIKETQTSKDEQELISERVSDTEITPSEEKQ